MITTRSTVLVFIHFSALINTVT